MSKLQAGDPCPACGCPFVWGTASMYVFCTCPNCPNRGTPIWNQMRTLGDDCKATPNQPTVTVEK